MLKRVQVSEGHSLIVEVDPSADSGSRDFIAEFAARDASRGDLPPDATPVSARSKLSDAAILLQSQMDSLAHLATSIIESAGPEEVSLEAHIKFAGDTQIVPFLVSAKGEGGLKVTVTWKRS
ncbi:MAG: hypothetical protein Rhims3KO_36100 [Hyphomicrobiales bacterium]